MWSARASDAALLRWIASDPAGVRSQLDLLLDAELIDEEPARIKHPSALLSLSSLYQNLLVQRRMELHRPRRARAEALVPAGVERLEDLITLTVLNEFYRIAFRKKVYEFDRRAAGRSGDADTDGASRVEGRWCFGKTQMQTFLECDPDDEGEDDRRLESDTKLDGSIRRRLSDRVPRRRYHRIQSNRWPRVGWSFWRYERPIC